MQLIGLTVYSARRPVCYVVHCQYKTIPQYSVLYIIQ